MEEGQDIDSALKVFRKLVQDEYGRPWYKSRYGYHESRSELRRKRKKSRRLIACLFRDTGTGADYRAGPPTDNRIAYQDLFAQTGNSMSTPDGWPPCIPWRDGITVAYLKTNRKRARH